MVQNVLQSLLGDAKSVEAVLRIALRIGFIVVLAWALNMFIGKAIRRLRIRITQRLDDAEMLKRAETLWRVFRYTSTVVLFLLASLLVLSELGISIAPILGAAGVVGLAVGFGTQSLVKDYFTGFFLLLENQIRQGDIVKLGEHAGLVEEVTLRYVRLRDYEGSVHFVPNGTITSVINSTRGYAYAVVDVSVAYSEKLSRVMQAMQDVALALRGEEAFQSIVLENLELAGVESLNSTSVIIRGRLRVKPQEASHVRRAYLLRLKDKFDSLGIETPKPYLLEASTR